MAGDYELVLGPSTSRSVESAASSFSKLWAFRIAQPSGVARHSLHHEGLAGFTGGSDVVSGR